MRVGTVNVASWFNVRAGIPEHARSIGAALETVLPVYYQAHRFRGIEDNEPAPISTAAAPGDVTIWVMNAPELARHHKRQGRKHVGVFMWEVEGVPPPSMREAVAKVDEVWAFSKFVARMFEGCGKPVHHVPSLVPEMPHRARAREVPFRVLAICDTASNLERKNPLGVLEAFQRAFDPNDAVELVVKTRRVDLAPGFWSGFKLKASGWPVRVLDVNLAVNDHRQMIADADCFVSLHRSEGQGLPIAEALRAGIPTIATAFGGNVDWQTRTNSILVPYRAVTLQRASPPYPVGSRWAEPDVNRAAAALRRLYEDRAGCAALGLAARAETDVSLHPNRARAVMLERLAALTS